MSDNFPLTRAAMCKATLLLAGTLLMPLGNPIAVRAQFIENPRYGYQSYHRTIFFPATEAEREKFYEVEDLHAEEIRSLKKQLEETEEKLNALERTQTAKIEQLMTDAQWEFVTKEQRERTRWNVKDNVPFLHEFATFSAQFTKAEKFTIFEGLPRGAQEEMDKIKAKEKTIQLAGFDFYAEPLVGKPMTGEFLRVILTDYRHFSPYEDKLCGGFHPDICLQYEIAGEKHLAQICLGCGELKILSPGKEYTFDFDGETRRTILQIAASIFVHDKPKERGY